MEPGHNVLVVEDSDVDFEQLARTFALVAPEVVLDRCETGDEALDYLFNRGEYALVAPPSLLMLDLEVPGVDGLEVLETIKEDVVLRALPVIVFTGSFDRHQRDAAYRCGASAFISKPRTRGRYEEMVRAMAAFWLEQVDLPSVS